MNLSFFTEQIKIKEAVETEKTLALKLKRTPAKCP